MAKTTNNYEYPHGEKPTPEENALYEAVARIIEGKSKRYALITVEHDKVVVYHTSDLEGTLDLVLRSSIVLTEKRRQAK